MKFTYNPLTTNKNESEGLKYNLAMILGAIIRQ